MKPNCPSSMSKIAEIHNNTSSNIAKTLQEPWVMILGKSLSKSMSECTFIMNSRIAVTSCHDYPLASSVPDSRCRQLSPKFGDCCQRCLYVLKSGWSWLDEFTPRSHLSCLVVIKTYWKAGQPKHRFQVQPSYTQGRKLVTNHNNKGLAYIYHIFKSSKQAIILCLAIQSNLPDKKI
jgi:hypothetical protein